MELHRIDPKQDLEHLRAFLAESDPEDYLLEGIEEWVEDGLLWVAEEGSEWVAFGRLHDLGDGQGWVSGLRIQARRRGRGIGGAFLGEIVSAARTAGLGALRAVIEDGNMASRRLFARHGFRPVVELALRCSSARSSESSPLHRARTGDKLDGPVGWIPEASGLIDLLPGTDAGRFGRWEPGVLDRWSREGKLYTGPGLAVAIQTDWLAHPRRTMWANPLRGEVRALLPAIGLLAASLGQEEWQAFLPSSPELRQEYAALDLFPHPSWGDRVHLYERGGAAPVSRR